MFITKTNLLSFGTIFIIEASIVFQGIVFRGNNLRHSMGVVNT